MSEAQEILGGLDRSAESVRVWSSRAPKSEVLQISSINRVDRSSRLDMIVLAMSLSLGRDLEQAQRWFHALSDETRLQLLELLRGGEQCVCDLTDALDAAQSRLSFHLKTLKDAGLVTDRKQGRWVYYALNPQVFDEITEFMTELRPKPTSFRLAPRRCD